MLLWALVYQFGDPLMQTADDEMMISGGYINLYYGYYQCRSINKRDGEERKQGVRNSLRSSSPGGDRFELEAELGQGGVLFY